MGELRVYRFVGLLPTGRKKAGFVSAFDTDEARKRLLARGIHVLKIYQVPSFLCFLFPLTSGQHALFFGTVARLLRAGVPLAFILEQLAMESFSVRYSRIIQEILISLDEGNSFAESIARTGVWSEDIIEVIRAGEIAGRLPEVLDSVVDIFKKKDKIRRAVVSSSVYPVVLFCLAIGVLAYAPKILAKVATFYKRFPGAELPWFTRVVVGFFQTFTLRLPYILSIALLMLLIVVSAYKRSEKARLFMDKIVLSLPIIGRYVYLVSGFRSFMVLRCLLASGVSLDRALRLVLNQQFNLEIKNAWKNTLELVQRGLSFREAVRHNMFVDNTVKVLLASGEVSGLLEQALEEAEELYSEKFDGYVKFLNDAIAPIAVGVVAVFVGIIVFAMYLPMLKIPQLIKYIR